MPGSDKGNARGNRGFSKALDIVTVKPHIKRPQPSVRSAFEKCDGKLRFSAPCRCFDLNDRRGGLNPRNPFGKAPGPRVLERLNAGNQGRDIRRQGNLPLEKLNDFIRRKHIFRVDVFGIKVLNDFSEKGHSLRINHAGGEVIEGRSLCNLPVGNHEKVLKPQVFTRKTAL